MSLSCREYLIPRRSGRLPDNVGDSARHPGRRSPRTRRGSALFLGLATLALIVGAGIRSPVVAAVQTDTLTLADAVRMALTNSPTLRQAEAQQLMEAAAGWEAWDRLLPSVNFSTDLVRDIALRRTAADPITGGIVELEEAEVDRRETFGTSARMSASWTVFDGGRNLQDFRRSRAQARAADLEFDAARSRMAAVVTTAYLDALEAAAQEEVTRAEVLNAAELERTAIGRFEAGEVPEVDALRARLAASDAELALLEAGTNAREARLALLEHLRLPLGQEPVLAEPAVPDPNTLPVPDELRRRAFEQSAELASFQARLEAVQRGLGSERWWFLPAVSVGATWARTEFGGTRQGLTLSPRNEGTTYWVSFGWSPLQRPGGTAADYRRASAGLQIAQADLELRRASLVRQVEGALDRLAGARVLQERSALNVRLAERQREQEEERYRLGVGTLSDRLEADTLTAQAARQEINARYATLRALAELEQAAGVRFLEFE